MTITDSSSDVQHFKGICDSGTWDLFLLVLGTVCLYSESLLKQKWGEGTKCCVDVTDKTPRKRGESDDASLALSVRDSFLRVRADSPSKAADPPRERTRNISTPDTLVFSFVFR